MIVRALVLLVAFVAGPAVSWNCLFSCSAPAPEVASDHACHGATDVNGLGAAPDCDASREHYSPFVKTTASVPGMLAGSVAWQLTGERLAAPSASVFLPVDTGPPGLRIRAPLRI